MNNIIFIVAGGTGGHIIPALALYEKIKNKDKVFFICRKKDLEIVEQLKDIKNDIIFLPGRGILRKISIKNFTSIFYLIFAILISFLYIIYYRPKVILSFGGYLSFSVLLNAILTKTPFYIFEQNSYPGFVNRLFGKYAKKVFVNFEWSKKFFKNAVVIGNPLRESLKQKISLNKALKFFNFKNKKDVLLVMGGSQGALKINEVFSKVIEKLNKFNIIWITGKNNYEKFKKFNKKGEVFVAPYIKKMEYVYRIAKIAICRAGALTITELSYFGIPAVFIPLPISAENHQFINAKLVENSGGSFVIQEKFLSPHSLIEKIYKIKKNYNKMKNCMKKFYYPNSTEKAIQIIEKDLKKSEK